jgi:hypothetical protein
VLNEWFKALKSGRDMMEDLLRSSRSSTSATEVNIAKMKEMVTENPHSTFSVLAVDLSVSHESIRTILTNQYETCCRSASLKKSVFFPKTQLHENR